MKKYKIEVVITEGCDEFWEELESENKSGVDEIETMVSDALYGRGFCDAKIKLVEYTNK